MAFAIPHCWLICFWRIGLAKVLLLTGEVSTSMHENFGSAKSHVEEKLHVSQRQLVDR